MKRTFDVFVAGAGVVVLLPLFLLLAWLVRISMGSPVLFTQLRVGLWGRDFTLFKFRTMTVRRGADQGTFDVGDRTRVTRMGKILRKTKLDELPQLWNVIRGDMSLVGPRPEVRKWVEAFPSRWKTVLTVRPGITDPAAIEFRNEEELLVAVPDPEAYYRDVVLSRKLDLYEQYVKTRSFWGDVGILFRTIGVVVGKTKV